MKKINQDAAIREELELVDSYLYILNVRFGGEIHFRKQVDETLLDLRVPSMILQPIVENAIKYNKEHGWVRVKLDADHQYFSVEVADSGIGIPAESIDHIYERFYRVDKSRSREIGGTGLGLAITRSAILMHRGTIKVESIEGEGTTFTIRIPLKYIPV